ncbi:MAG: restriction endonuclease [Proteobacteria bacterium]|nr:restriction endonuclease [Pseudomonadota bacterium]
MNHLHYGDNLRVLRESVDDTSVDLIYLDPPFNSNASYNVLFKGPGGTDSQAQIEAFDDTWHWTTSAEEAFAEVLTSGNSDASEMLRAMRQFLGDNDMMAYLAMMAVRLIELHRVLKPTGSLYLHCDPTASHYLKILLDAVFGARNFRAEIVWKRTNARGTPRNWPHLHDVIFHYSDKNIKHAIPKVKADESKMPHTLITWRDGKKYQTYELTGAGITQDGESGKPWRGFNPTGMGRHWGNSHAQLNAWAEADLIHFPPNNGFPRRRDEETFNPDNRMVTVGDVWVDIDRINQAAKERLGYPTQKPVALLERIISASSNPGDLVLDPFCGCGTTVHAAEKLNRRWIGIDITHVAINLIRRRLRDAFEGIEFGVHGVPMDLAGARELAEADKHQFELWAISLIPNAQPWKGGKKGADKGIDGVLYVTGEGKKTERCIISVKGGANVGVAMIRDLVGTMDREKAPMSLFLTLAPPTKPMVAEAASAGFWDTDWGQVPRLQIGTVEQLLTSPAPPFRIPMARSDTYRKAAREERSGRQGALDL